MLLLGLLHWPLPLNRAAACTYMPNASWRRRGVASARGGGYPTLGTKRSESGKGGAKRRAAQAKRGSLGKPLAGARGGAPECTGEMRYKTDQRPALHRTWNPYG